MAFSQDTLSEAKIRNLYPYKRGDEHPHTFHMGSPPPGIIHDRMTNIVKLLFDSDRRDFDPQKGS